MRNAILGLTAGLVITMPIAVAQAEAFGSSIQDATRTVAQSTTNQDPLQGAKGSPVVERRIVVADPADEPYGQFHKAWERFLTEDLKTAATEVRKGEAFLKLEARHAKGEAKKALAASIRESKKLAREVEKGAITSTQELERMVTRADRAWAQQHFQTAAEFWSKQGS